MAASIYQENSEFGSESGISRQDVEAAMAKAVELRALHAALMQGNSPAASAAANFSVPSSSPVSRHAPPQFSAQDYPVFTPSYEDEPSSFFPQNRNYADGWADPTFDETVLSDYPTANTSSRKGLPSEPDRWRSRPARQAVDDQDSISDFALRASPGPDHTKSRRNSLGDARNGKKSNIVVPLTDSHSSLHSHSRSKGLIGLSWLFPKGIKKKNKNENIIQMNSRPDDFVIPSIDALKIELTKAVEDKDAALNEVSEMKSSIGELSRKLEYLETYCEELKRALRQVQTCPQPAGKLANFSGSVKSGGGSFDDQMPVSKEVMVEGFLQVVSEARLSVKQFCKTLIKQIEENDYALKDNLNSFLKPYKLSLNSKYSKAVLYHLEAFVNQSLYQDFENCVFQKNGGPKALDPAQERKAKFQLFVSLRNLSWNEVLRKGTKYYSEEFSKFCDQKMSGVIGMLSWSRPWPEQLLQAFFVAAKCIWLVHLLAFSFNPGLGILRVNENKAFEESYMEEMGGDKQRPNGLGRVKVMVMPGFYVHGEVLRCKVLCRYKSVV